MTVPAVSVFIASYNGERFVGEAVQSVLDQSFRDLELVVVDDGSGPATLEILRAIAATDPRMRLLESAHQGQIAALNRAIALCRAPLIARLDHDDIALPVRIARQKAYLDANPDAVAVGGEVQMMDGVGRDLAVARVREKRLDHRPDAFPPRPVFLMGPTVMARADAMARIGGFRVACTAAEDRDLCWQLGFEGRVVRLPEIFCRYRWHGANLSKTARRTQFYSHLLSDLSAIARHHRRDDAAILAAVEVGGDYGPAIEGYRRLLNGRYPVETLVLYSVARDHAAGLAGYRDHTAFLAAVRAHVAIAPWQPHRLKLAVKAFKTRAKGKGWAD